VPEGANVKLEELTQEQLDELIANRDAQNDSIKGLKADIAKLKAKAKGADIDPEEHAALKLQVEELNEKLGKSEGLSKKEIEKLTKQLGEKDGALQKYLIDANLTESLAKAGVKPEFMDASKALLKSSAAIKSDNGEYVPVIGDKPLADYVTEWAKGDQGKHFVAAPASSGGGAGGGSASQGKEYQSKPVKDWTPAQKAEFVGEHGIQKWQEKLSKG
jgi:hypothetical protein